MIAPIPAGMRHSRRSQVLSALWPPKVDVFALEAFK